MHDEPTWTGLGDPEAVVDAEWVDIDDPTGVEWHPTGSAADGDLPVLEADAEPDSPGTHELRPNFAGQDAKAGPNTEDIPADGSQAAPPAQPAPAASPGFGPMVRGSEQLEIARIRKNRRRLRDLQATSLRGGGSPDSRSSVTPVDQARPDTSISATPTQTQTQTLTTSTPTSTSTTLPRLLLPRTSRPPSPRPPRSAPRSSDLPTWRPTRDSPGANWCLPVPRCRLRPAPV